MTITNLDEYTATDSSEFTAEVKATWGRYIEESFILDLELISSEGELIDLLTDLAWTGGVEPTDIEIDDFQGFRDGCEPDDLIEALETLEYITSADDEEMAWDLLEHTGCLADSVSMIQDCYHGTWDNFEAYAWDYVDNCMEIPDNMTGYFDIRSFARDLEYDYECISCSAGVHVFSNL